MRSQTISAVHDALGSTRLTVPKRVLSWWWSMLTMRPRRRPSTGLRSMLPQSRKTIVRSSTSSGDDGDQPVERRRSGTRRAAGTRRRAMNISESLPSARRTPCMRDERAERVAVGVLVGDQDEALAVAQLDRAPRSRVVALLRRCVTPRRPRRLRQLLEPHRAVASCRRRGSSSVGVCFRRSSPRDAPLQGRRARSAGPRACWHAAPRRPRTLTYTRAWRRSGLVLTSVTVTKPMRGSLQVLWRRRR